jgi:hypothetical protein
MKSVWFPICLVSFYLLVYTLLAYWSHWQEIVLMMFLYALLINHLGFVVTSALFLACAFRVLGERRIFVLTTVAAGVSLGLWLLFRMLDVRLDWGLFGRLLS